MNLSQKIINKLRLGFRLSSLGADFFSRCKLLLIFLWLPIQKRLGLRNDINVKVALRKFNRRFDLYLTDSSDLAILKEIFLDDEYDVSLNCEPDIIFDLGSNVGLSVIYFKLKYPNSKIYCFEPDPATYQKLRKNTLQFFNIFLFSVAVSDMVEEAKFYISESSMSSSLVERERGQKFIFVKNNTLDNIMKENKLTHVDLLKFDVEGAEDLIFRSCKDLGNFRKMIGEVHLDLIKTSKERFLDIFRDEFELKIRPISAERFLLEADNKKSE